MDSTDIELLRAYAEAGDERSFEELVKRHVGLVYSTALRSLGGDAHLAQDVAQMVFTRLAQHAQSLVGQRALAGWLFRDAFFTASKLVRSERRRVEREKQAIMPTPDSSADQTHANELLPMLDEIISRLRPKERDALVLRFFNGMEFRAAAVLLGISEAAFEKRVERAVRKLRAALACKGVTASSGAITAALLAGGLAASTPPTLAAAIAASSLTSAAAVKSSTFLTLVSSLAMTKLKIIGSAIVIAAVTTAIVVQQNALRRLRQENRQLRTENQRRSAENNPVTRTPEAIAPAEVERLRAEELELLRLRGEVGVRRRQIEELKAQLEQAGRTEPRPQDTQHQQEGGRYVAAEAWSNLGFGAPQSAAITLFWALRNANQAGYSGALGKAMPAPGEAWVDAFKSVKGSFLSDPEPQPNGDVRVSVAHETTSGELVNTLLTYRQENGQWLIRNMAGFPIVVLEANSGAAGYALPVSGPSTR